MKRILLVKFILILNIMVSIAQNQTKQTMDELKLKNKEELIQMGLDILKEKDPSLVINSDDFESTAWGNSKEIIVKFRRYIRFIPLQKASHYHYDVTVDLISERILPFDYGCDVNFYIPSAQDKKKLDFIKANADFPQQSDFEITITENEDNYWISKKSKTAFSKFFINKKTGSKSGLMEGSFTVNPPKPVLESIYEKEETIRLLDKADYTEDTIIKMAVELLTKKQPLLELNPDDYEITVLGNSKNTLVKFRRIIQYVPLVTANKKKFSYDITVNLNTNEISPFDHHLKPDFYIETKEDKKAIEFVKKNFGGFSTEFESTIYEGEEEYVINLKNKYSYSKYVLNKKTGKKHLTRQASSDPWTKPELSEDLDILTEIK